MVGWLARWSQRAVLRRALNRYELSRAILGLPVAPAPSWDKPRMLEFLHSLSRGLTEQEQRLYGFKGKAEQWVDVQTAVRDGMTRDLTRDDPEAAVAATLGNVRRSLDSTHERLRDDGCSVEEAHSEALSVLGNFARAEYTLELLEEFSAACRFAFDKELGSRERARRQAARMLQSAINADT